MRCSLRHLRASSVSPFCGVFSPSLLRSTLPASSYFVSSEEHQVTCSSARYPDYDLSFAPGSRVYAPSKTRRDVGRHFERAISAPHTLPQKSVFYHDSTVTVLYEMESPIAAFHLLLLPKHIFVNDYAELRGVHHSTELATMHELALDIAKHLCSRHSSAVSFRAGAETVPFRSPFHLHLISTDLCRARSKQRWNVYASRALIDAEELSATLRTHGSVRVEPVRLLNEISRPPRCLRCGLSNSSIASLRRHALTCTNRSQGHLVSLYDANRPSDEQSMLRAESGL